MRPSEARRHEGQLGTVHYHNGHPARVEGRIKVDGRYLTVHDPDPKGARRGDPIPLEQIQRIEIDGQPAQLAFD